MFEPAVTGLVEQVDGTLAETETDGRFPVSAEPDTGAWTWADETVWCGGFWGGLLWLAAATGDDRYARAAAGQRPQCWSSRGHRGRREALPGRGRADPDRADQ